MIHNHHQHGCDHVSTKYCRACNVVYCIDCGEQWRKDVSPYNPNLSYYTFPTWKGLGSSIGSNFPTGTGHTGHI